MSYKSSKNALIFLNMGYVVSRPLRGCSDLRGFLFDISHSPDSLQMVAFVLIGVATYGKTSNVITSLEIVGGVVASGIFLLFIAVAGLFGALKHHQVSNFRLVLEYL